MFSAIFSFKDVAASSDFYLDGILGSIGFYFSSGWLFILLLSFLPFLWFTTVCWEGCRPLTSGKSINFNLFRRIPGFDLLEVALESGLLFFPKAAALLSRMPFALGPLEFFE